MTLNVKFFKLMMVITTTKASTAIITLIRGHFKCMLSVNMESLTFIYFVASPAWAFVGQGSNMEPRSDYSVNTPKVIVSRSHSGKVTSYIKKAFGNSTNIIPAGGAGEQRILKKGREFLKCTEYTF